MLFTLTSHIVVAFRVFRLPRQLLIDHLIVNPRVLYEIVIHGFLRESDKLDFRHGSSFH